MRTGSRQLSGSPRRALTVIELMVTVALVGIVLVSVSQIFRITSDAAKQVEANAEVVQRARDMNDRLENELGNLASDSLLVINCPTPIAFTREFGGGPFVPLHRDSVVLLTRGNVGEYESFVDPTGPTTANPDPELGPARSSEAIVYLGPGTPLEDSPSGLPQPLPIDQATSQLTAREWMFLHRVILLIDEVNPDSAATWNPPTMDAAVTPGGPLNNTNGGLLGLFAQGQMDAIVSGATLRANVDTVSRIVLSRDLATDLLTDTPSIQPLWSPSWAPKSVTLDPDLSHRRDYYRKAGATFMPRLADFRVEWTDGGVDLVGADGIPDSGDEGGTRWFGLRPERGSLSAGDVDNITSGVAMRYEAVRRQDVDETLLVLPNGQPDLVAQAAERAIRPAYEEIEWPTGGQPGASTTAAYRAIWRGDTWQSRPRALRFTYRLYDANERLRQATEVDFNRNGQPDPDGVLPSRQVQRAGREFSVVVRVP